MNFFPINTHEVNDLPLPTLIIPTLSYPYRIFERTVWQCKNYSWSYRIWTSRMEYLSGYESNWHASSTTIWLHKISMSQPALIWSSLILNTTRFLGMSREPGTVIAGILCWPTPNSVLNKSAISLQDLLDHHIPSSLGWWSFVPLGNFEKEQMKLKY